MPDKGILAITYNFLNLPTEINQNDNTLKYFYRADGTKLKKEFTLVNRTGTKVINTEYLDGFQYSTPNTEPLRTALEAVDDATMKATTAGEEEAFSRDTERKVVVVDPGNPQTIAMALSFFPTAEGYYDYENLRYIYQYKDHLGNVRVSYLKDSNNTLKVMDTNDYYPFGMSFLKGSQQAIYDPLAIPYNYKYNGKELQETGMYDYGARFYMPDIGRWGTIDPLAEQYLGHSTYNYVMNNPLKFTDPTGMAAEHVDPTEIYKNGNKQQIKAFEIFAKSKEGQSVIGKFAEAGQVIAGVKYNESGEYHEKGMDLNFDNNVSKQAVAQGASGETSTEVKDGRINFTVSVGNNETPYRVGAQIEVFAHETFIHVQPEAKDFFDDKKFNQSGGYDNRLINFLKQPKNKEFQSTRYYDHYQEKQNHNARNNYISPLLQRYFKSINKNVTKEQINNSIDGFRY